MVVGSPVLEKPAPGVQAVAVGAYTEVIDILAPSEAEAGDEVTIVAAVKNIGAYTFYIHVGGRYDGTEFEFSPHSAAVDANGVYSFSGSFIMPNHDVRVHFWSYYWTGSEWVPDDYDYVDVRLAVPVGWQLLDSVTLGVGVAVAPPVGWQLLASTTLGVSPAVAPPTGWQLLESATVSIAPGPLPPEYELLEHVITPWAYFYEGAAEVASIVFTLPIGTKWLATEIANNFADELKERGSTLLEGKFYRDASALVVDKYRVDITAIAPEAGTIGWAIPWNLVFWASVAVLVGLIIYWAVNWVRSVTFHPEPLSEAVKVQWSRETLINMITDLRPQIPPETLAEKSDQELRDIMNEIYEEEVPPAGLPWWGWAIFGGLGIAGATLALRFLPKKKE